jgi:hypothetical protein
MTVQILENPVFECLKRFCIRAAWSISAPVMNILPPYFLPPCNVVVDDDEDDDV